MGIEVLAKARAMLMPRVVTVRMPVVVVMTLRMAMIGVMVMLAVGTVHMLRAQPLDEGVLTPSTRGHLDQPDDLLRLRHFAP